MTSARIVWLDVARGGAIVAMVIYHFAFDLLLFGLVDWPVDRHPLWRGFAAGIASTFLFLAGAALVVAHGEGVRWGPFWRRVAVVGAAAFAVTVATVFTMPAPIYFGILHAIALFSVLALPFLFAPAWVTLAVASVVLILPAVFRHPIFEGPVFYALGLSPTVPYTFDYEPIFPWFAVTLLGVVAGRNVPMVRGVVPKKLRPLSFMGRFSLLIYLLHQPVLFGGLMGVTMLINRG